MSLGCGIVMADQIVTAQAAGVEGTFEGAARVSVALAEAVPSGIRRLELAPYAKGEDDERNRVRVALRKWLLARCTWPSATELNSTLDKLCMSRTLRCADEVGGRRLSGKVLTGLFADLTAEEAVTMLAARNIAEAPALAIFRGGGVASSGAATPAAASAVAGPSGAGGLVSNERRCGRCARALKSAVVMVVDKQLTCNKCYANISGSVERVDVRRGTGEVTQTAVISLASASRGKTEKEVRALMRLWEAKRLRKCPGEFMVVGKRVQAVFPRTWRSMNVSQRQADLAETMPAMASEHVLYAQLGDAVFKLLDEQKQRAGQMYDDMYNAGITVEEDVRYDGVEVVYVKAPAPAQDAHDDCVGGRRMQFAVLCTPSKQATRLYHFKGDGFAYVQNVRACTLGNDKVDKDKFTRVLRRHGDLAAVTLGLAGPDAARVVDLPMFPGHLRPGHAWGLGSHMAVIHAGPPVPTPAEANDEEGSAGDASESDEEGGDRCLVVASVSRNSLVCGADGVPEQRQGPLHLIDLGLDATISSNTALQAALRTPFMSKLGVVDWAEACGRDVEEVRRLLNPAAEAAASTVGSSATETGTTAARPGVGDVTVAQPRRPHPLVAVYRPSQLPVFKHGHDYVFVYGSTLAWSHRAVSYVYEAMKITRCPSGGLQLTPIAPERWKPFRVNEGDVIIMKAGFRGYWNADIGEAEKQYSYFNEDGEVEDGGAGDGVHNVYCEKCGQDCWDESHRLTKECAAHLGIAHTDKTGADLCTKCLQDFKPRLSEKRFRPTRQAFGRAWRPLPDPATSDAFYPPAVNASPLAVAAPTNVPTSEKASASSGRKRAASSESQSPCKRGSNL
jgi:hypothetical protein